MDLSPLIQRLIAGGAPLSGAEAEALGHALAQSSPGGGAGAGAGGGAAALCPLQLSSLLSLLARDDEAAAASAGAAAGGYTSAQLVGLARALRAAARRVPLAGAAAPLVDIVGTGGDGSNSVNISTGAAILAAAAGATVAKHGSVGASSRSGAADCLASLGVAHCGPAAAARCLADERLAFLFAPLYHPALAAAAPVRRALRARTIFNLLVRRRVAGGERAQTPAAAATARRRRPRAFPPPLARRARC
jgi:anthranilate phosphoribosyltransferase